MSDILWGNGEPVEPWAELSADQINKLNELFQDSYEVGIPILTTGGINLHEKFFFNSTEKKPTAKKNLRKKTTAKKTSQKKPPKNSP